MKFIHLSAGALALALTLGRSGNAFAYACPQNPPPARDATYQGFLGRVYELNGKELPYRLFVPEGYDPANAYPLVLYLHHAGLAGSDSHNETGWDNCVHLTSEIGSGDDYGGVFTHQAVDKDGKRFETQQRYPHFVLAPHAESPAYGFGGGVAGSASGAEHPTRALLKGILADVQAEFHIDAARLYVTGISMGCYGTWDFIMRDPSVFAAASPQSCRGDPNTNLLARLKDLPIWSMCGTKDSYFSGAQAMADGMKQIGATAFTFTAMEGVGHSINDRGYDYPGFIDWMFAQRRADVPSSGSAGAGGGSAAGAGGAGTAGSAAAGGMFGAGSGAAGSASGGAISGRGGMAGDGGGGAGGAGAAAMTGGMGVAQAGAASAGIGNVGGANTAHPDATASSGCAIARGARQHEALMRFSALILLAGALARRQRRRAGRNGGAR